MFGLNLTCASENKRYTIHTHTIPANTLTKQAPTHNRASIKESQIFILLKQNLIGLIKKMRQMEKRIKKDL